MGDHTTSDVLFFTQWHYGSTHVKYSVKPPLSAGGLSERVGLTGPQLSGKEGMTFFRRVGCNFHIKNKLKSEIFNDKKSL